MKIKGLAALLMAFVLILGGCAATEAEDDPMGGQDMFSTETLSYREANNQAFMRAIWVSYMDIAPMVSAGNAGFAAQIDTMLDNLATISATDIFFQVRAFGDSFFASSVYPLASNTIYGNLSGDFDYLQTLLEKAHARGIRVHAWVNLYRLHTSQSQAYQAFIDRLVEQDAKIIATIDGKRFLNPASAAARNLIITGVQELLDRYDFDGIHLDDYFYPATDDAYDDHYFTLYTSGGGSKNREDWRRDNITETIRQIYRAVKDSSAAVEFGISPDASIERNHSRHYLDVELLCREAGYIDYICPQVYFGYQNQSMPFLPTVSRWAALATGCKLIVGLSYYKVGADDIYAGSGGSEWLESFDIISRQYLDSIEISNCNGVAFFRYNSIFYPDDAVATFAQLELYNLQQAIG